MAANEGLRPYMWCMSVIGIVILLLPRENYGLTDRYLKEIQLTLNSSATIHSPGYPHDYDNSEHCKWTVTPTATRRVSLKFMDFNLESDDFLYIGTVNNIRALSYSGYHESSEARIISSVGESLLIEFITDKKNHRKGFSLLVTDVADGDYILCHNGLEILRDSFTCYDCPDEETHLDYKASVTIQSPSYPADYSNNLRCEWIVTPTVGRRVLVYFLDFHLEHEHDFLYIKTSYSHSTILAYSGYHESSEARVISAVSQSLQFEFKTDFITTRRGFSMLVTDAADGDYYALCSNGLEIQSESFICQEPEPESSYGYRWPPYWYSFLYASSSYESLPTSDSCDFVCPNGDCIPTHWLCDDINDCGDLSDEDSCVDNNDCPEKTIQLSLNDAITIQSPNYPNNYPNDLQCQWIVTPAPTRRVLVQFLDFTYNQFAALYIGTITNPRAFIYDGPVTPQTRIVSPINESLQFDFRQNAAVNTNNNGFALLLLDEAGNGKKPHYNLF
ncbi:tolloid-like protein 2 [Amphiura filiformis]|uniref:tolloid-like protein 2 n=1 Tax=Amphiura filiformis TaxID=82378 RepID=UPI003B2158D5